MRKTYKAGEIICRENSFENWMYELITGSVEIIKHYEESDEQSLSVITNGYFGEMGLIDNLPRTATVIAKEDSEVEIIDEKAFSEYFANEPEKVTSLFLCLIGKLSQLNDNYTQACQTMKDYLAAETANRQKGIHLIASMKRFASIFTGR